MHLNLLAGFMFLPTHSLIVAKFIQIKSIMNICLISLILNGRIFYDKIAHLDQYFEGDKKNPFNLILAITMPHFRG